ncbi:MAG: FecR family protein [Runella sp.]
MKPYSDFVFYKVDDFLGDAEFKAWIRNPNPEYTAYWQGLLQTHPHLRESFEQARLMALGMEASFIPFSDAYHETLFEKIEIKLTPQIVPMRKWVIGRVAASVALLVFGVATAYWLLMTPRYYQTQFSQTQLINLPDGSEVRLNANSRLTVASWYEWRQNRTLSLEGEAYFKVKKQADDDTKHYRKFTVLTKQAKVEVLGTQFNVYARNSQTRVYLDEGKVRLISPKSSSPLMLRPGQIATVSPAQKSVAVAIAPSTEIQEIKSYTNNLLVFNDASLDELYARFKEVYGIELVLKGEAFDGQQFRGELPVENLEDALLILSATFNQKPLRDGNKVYFVSKD